MKTQQKHPISLLNNLWIDDDGFIAAGSGDTYITIADCDCSDMDIDDRESIKNEIVKRCNSHTELLEALTLMYELVNSGQAPGNEDLDRAFAAIQKVNRSA